MYFDSVETWASQKHFEDLNVVVFNDSGISYFNYSVKLLVDFRRTLISFDLKKKSSEAQRNYDLNVFNSNVDSCKAAQGLFGNYIIKFLLTHNEKNSNIKPQCPQKKGFYYAYNFAAPDNIKDFLPSFMPTPAEFWELTIIGRAKISANGGAIRVFRIVGQGRNVWNSLFHWYFSSIITYSKNWEKTYSAKNILT